jgi:DNA-directed RNA polymerase
MGYNFSPFLRQIALEQDMRGRGAEKWQSDVRKAKEGERESETTYGDRLLKAVVDPLSVQVKAYLERAKSGAPGAYHTLAPKIETLHPDVIAYLAVKTILNVLSSSHLEQEVATAVGRSIEEELRFRAYHEQKPALFDTIMRDHKKRRKSKKFTKRVMKLRVAKAGAVWTDWTERDCLKIGFYMIKMLLKVEPQIIAEEPVTVRTKRKHKPAFRLVFGPGIKDLIGDLTVALCGPSFLPTVVTPRPWRSAFGGGYWTDAVDYKLKRLVKTRSLEYLEDLSHVNMPAVYSAINSVQETAWQINSAVLGVMRQAWEQAREIGSLPRDRKLEEPSKPAIKPPCRCYCDDKKVWSKTPEGQAWRAWRKMAHAVHEFNIKTLSKRVQARMTMDVAKRFENGEPIYFPNQLDFRSRMYAMPAFLQPQGADYVRGLLRFHVGKPITTITAKNWLAIHGANCYGIDKVSFHERVDWVRKWTREIKMTAASPMDMVDWWGEAENPWQFLAFCFEWADLSDGVEGFVSHLPVSLDGTCNGLQHFSAMLRDPVGGAAVNLTPSDKPQDIYAVVAERVVITLKADADPLAAQWLAFGVDRKLCKRPVMILPYGGTQYACRKYVEEYVLKLISDKGKTNPFADLMTAVVYLAKIIWHAIGETVVAAKTAMKWLQKSARVISKKQLAIVWQTPAGFPVRQAYPEMRDAEVDLIIDGKRLCRLIKVETTGLDYDQQVSGLSPNFVHSLDASALMETVRVCRIRGIKSFAMVHDSYGTHAADTQALTETLREAFVSLYEQHDVLAELRTAMVAAVGETGLDLAPGTGALDIREVLHSRFFFA